jgi:hypothetical protein
VYYSPLFSQQKSQHKIEDVPKIARVHRAGSTLCIYGHSMALSPLSEKSTLYDTCHNNPHIHHDASIYAKWSLHCNNVGGATYAEAPYVWQWSIYGGVQ